MFDYLLRLPLQVTLCLLSLLLLRPLSQPVVRTCLLKTATAKVQQVCTYSTAGNILLDEGEQCSLISQELADRLCQKGTHIEQICFLTFGNPAPAARLLEVATILIYTEDLTLSPKTRSYVTMALQQSSLLLV